MSRDQSYVLNKIIDSYREVNHWQIQHIHKGIKQADDGRFATKIQVKRALAKWRKRFDIPRRPGVGRTLFKFNKDRGVGRGVRRGGVRGGRRLGGSVRGRKSHRQ
jgi:predicted transcriptional regulator